MKDKVYKRSKGKIKKGSLYYSLFHNFIELKLENNKILYISHNASYIQKCRWDLYYREISGDILKYD